MNNNAAANTLDNKVLTFFLIAGEPSGDLLGARLMAALKVKLGRRPFRFVGVGGERMMAEGLETLFPMSDLALFGLLELLPKAPKLVRRFHQTVLGIQNVEPDVLVTIDAPSFTFRVGKKIRADLKKNNKKMLMIHYVAPTVWAWRPERARKIAQFLDHLLVLLPFEPPYFEKEGLACSFVGHSIIESNAGCGDANRFRARHKVNKNTRVITVLPGSRVGEVSRLLPIFKQTFDRLVETHPNMMVVIPTLAQMAPMVQKSVEIWPLPVLVVQGDEEKYDAFAASEVALAASGTVALELAMARLPSVIAYRLNSLTVALYRRLIGVKYVNLINILLDRLLVPELLQEDCRPEALAEAVGQILDDPVARRRQIEGYDDALHALRVEGASPSEQAAAVILQRVQQFSDEKRYTPFD
ncbi:Lipid-A-disaccharide synthase [Azospirillaceae bacterium]